MPGIINKTIIVVIMLLFGLLIFQLWKLSSIYTTTTKNLNYVKYATEEKSQLIRDFQERINNKLIFDYDSTPEYYFQHQKAASTPIEDLSVEELIKDDFFFHRAQKNLDEYNSFINLNLDEQFKHLYEQRIIREFMENYYMDLYDQGMMLDRFSFVKSFQDSLYFGMYNFDYENEKTKIEVNDSLVELSYSLNRINIPYSDTIRVKIQKLLNKGTYIDTLYSNQYFICQDENWNEK